MNVTLDLATGKDAAGLLGGAGAVYRYKVTDVQAGSCTNPPSGYQNVNITSPGTRVCDVFYAEEAKDEIHVDVLLVVPSDAVPGSKTDTFTATATAVP